MAYILLPGGRRLAYETWGDPNGTPVLFHHGTGDSRLARHPDEALALAARVWFVTVDRPGHGRSTPQPGRALGDWAADAERLLDELEIGRCVSAGWSGGGPYALALAHDLPGRVTEVALAASLAPMNGPGATKALHRDLRFLWRLRSSPFALWIATELIAAEARRSPVRFAHRWLDGGPRLDTEIFEEAQLASMLEEQCTEGFRQGAKGFFSDLMALARWHFELEGITQRVRIWHGADDHVLSIAMAQILQGRIPRAELHVLPGEGHFFLFRHWAQFIASAEVTEVRKRKQAAVN